ncbi:LAPTM4A.2 family protein [Megaselia abdita]
MVIWSNPTYVQNYDSYNNNVDFAAPALPTPVAKVDNQFTYSDKMNMENFDMGGIVCMCMIAITLMMIYGAIKGKPSHLLPFFCLQLFDFVITTLTATGYLCYLQAMPRIIAETHRLPWREKLLELSPRALITVVLITFAALVFLKAYSIGIIWRCYRYLTIRQYDLRSVLPYIIPYVPTNRERDLSTLLPNYDDVIAQNMKQAPPPSYQVAMSNVDPTEQQETIADPPSYNNLQSAVPDESPDDPQSDNNNSEEHENNNDHNSSNNNLVEVTRNESSA